MKRNFAASPCGGAMAVSQYLPVRPIQPAEASKLCSGFFLKPLLESSCRSSPI
jgi:hypothetical protein